jgi:hypothetical protein
MLAWVRISPSRSGSLGQGISPHASGWRDPVSGQGQPPSPLKEQKERPPATTGTDAAETPLAQEEDLRRWLTRANALRPESPQLPVCILEPYAVLLSGDIGRAAKQLGTFLAWPCSGCGP